MDDILLAWRNVWRNPRRSTLTILAVLFAAALLIFMLSFQLGAYEEMIDSSVRLSTGHLQIQAPGYQDKPDIRKVVAHPEKIVELATMLPGVRSAGFRAETFALAAGSERSRGMAITGVDPVVESTLSSLPGMIREGRYLKKGDSEVAVIGSLAAQRLKINLGDECTLLGQARDGSVAAALVRIVGIYKTGIDEFDRASMQIPYTDFNTVFGMEGVVHRIIIIAEHLSDAPLLGAALKTLPELSSLSILTWDELNPGLKQGIELDLVGGVIMYAILVVVVAFSILNTFFMAIFERTREFGVLMAIGTKPIRLVKLMLLESFALTSVGLLAGIILGVSVTVYFAHSGISMGEGAELMAQYGISSRLYPKLSAISVFIGPGLIALVTFFTALVPVMRIPRLKPVDALRAL